jgi:hypothetical protein
MTERTTSNGLLLDSSLGFRKVTALRCLELKYVAADISKLVIRPAAATASLAEFIGYFTSELMPLQT